MVKIILVLNLFCCYGLLAQHAMEVNCDCKDEICYIPNWVYRDSLIKPSKRAFLRAYFNKFNQLDTFYLNFDKSNLQELKTVYRNDTSLIMVNPLRDANLYFRITAFYQKRTLAIKELECETYSGDTTCYEIYKITDSSVKYGDTKVGESMFKFIKRINIQLNQADTFNVTSDLFTDFVDPNFMLQYYSVTPIKIYYDKIKDYYAIYIYGFSDAEYQFGDSIYTYLCKIYVDLKRKKSGRIVMNGDYLEVYGLMKCTDFWIF